MLSRPLLEGTVRERLRMIGNVHVRDGCHADGLIASPDNSRVVGIRMNSNALFADLVVDATGRGSRSPQWLEEMGYGSPKEDKIEIKVGYATCRFRRSAHHLNGLSLVSVPATPKNKKGGVMLAQEGNVWIVILNAYCGMAVPT